MARRPEETPLQMIAESEEYKLDLHGRAIKALNEKVNALREEIPGKSLSSLRKDLDARTERLSDLEDHIEDETDALREKIGRLSERLNGLVSQSNKVRQVARRLDELEDSAADREEKLEAAARKLSRVEDRLEQLTSEVCSQIQGLEEEFRASESNLLQFTQHNENAINQLNEFLEGFASKHNAVNQRSRDNEERLDKLEDSSEGDESDVEDSVETVADWLQDGWLNHPFKRHICTAVQQFASGNYTSAQESLMRASRRVSEIALEEKEG